MNYDKIGTVIANIENCLIDAATGRGQNEAEYKQLRDVLLRTYHSTNDGNFNKAFPDILIKYQTINSFWQFIKHELATYEERRNYIHDKFSPLKQYIESKVFSSDAKLLKTEFKLSSNYISEMIDKANGRIKNKDYDGAITAARTLVEEVESEIYRELNDGKDNEFKGNMNKLYSAIAKKLNLTTDEDIDNRLKRILSGLYSVNDGIAGLRNVASDSHAKRYSPQAHHAQLAVNSAFTLCQFLCDTYLSQKTGVKK